MWYTVVRRNHVTIKERLFGRVLCCFVRSGKEVHRNKQVRSFEKASLNLFVRNAESIEKNGKRQALSLRLQCFVYGFVLLATLKLFFLLALW